jgi:hypothetical protein
MCFNNGSLERLESKISAVVFDRNSAAIGQGNGLEDGVF